MTTSSQLTRRSFLKGALALGAIIPFGGLLTACSGTAASEAESEPADEAEEPAAPQTAQETEAPADEPAASGVAAGSILVAYYSAQGHTRAVAEAIADQLGADLFEVTPTQPYTDDDLNWTDETSRVSVEHENPDQRDVELSQVTPDGWDGYGTVLVGYPIWWGIAAWPIDGFAEGNDFSGKTVIPFCTSASSPIGESGELLSQAAGTGDWQEGMRFRSSASADEVAEWAASLAL